MKEDEEFYKAFNKTIQGADSTSLYPLFDELNKSSNYNKTYTLTSPLYVDLPRKKGDKRIYFNLNTYRNLHYIVNNQAKIAYKDLMKEQIDKLPKLNRISLEFVLHKSSNRKIDRHNICTVIEKYFMDALQEENKIDGDDDKFIIQEVYKTGETIKNRGYCEIIITNYDK